MTSGAQRLTRVMAPPPAAAARAAAVRPVFEYTGETALTVVSPMTRKTYRFERPGARLEVDVVDRAWIAFIPLLKRVANS
jgi:hypothetical protein